MEAMLAGIIGVGGAVIGAAVAWFAARDAAHIQAEAARQIAKDARTRARRESQVAWLNGYVDSRLALYGDLSARLRAGRQGGMVEAVEKLLRTDWLYVRLQLESVPNPKVVTAGQSFLGSDRKYSEQLKERLGYGNEALSGVLLENTPDIHLKSIDLIAALDDYIFAV
jgi:hypothetical protein